MRSQGSIRLRASLWPAEVSASMENYQVLTVDEATIRAEAQYQAAQLDQRVAADPTHHNMVLLTAMARGQL